MPDVTAFLVLDELEFKLKTDLKCEGQNLSGGTYFQLKKPTMLHFERLEAQLELRSPPMLDGPLTSQVGQPNFFSIIKFAVAHKY